MTIDQLFQSGLQHHQAGRLQDAEQLYRQILGQQPNHAEALHLLGVMSHQMGRIDIVVELISKAIAVRPNYPEAHSNLGNALRDKGHLEEAIAAYRQAIALKPNYPEAHSNLGAALHDKGRLEESIAACRKAIALKPKYPEAHYNLGNSLKDKGHLDDAIAAYRQAIALKPTYAEAHSNLGAVLRGKGRLEEAVACYETAIELDPSLVVAREGLYLTMSALVPGWHAPMMNDRMRNDFYFSALKAVVTPDSNVLEIGTGSGLLSMMAATLGAKEVTTFEAVPLIAAAARGVIAENGLAQRIRVISKKSTEAAVGTDLPGVADILVSEVFSNEFLAEGVLSSIEDAKRRMLIPSPRIIPAAGSIMIALFGGDDIGSNLVVEDCCGFNLRHFNSVINRKHVVTRNDLKIELLTEDVEAFRFDFEKESFFPPQEKTLRIPVRTPGRCLGIIQWIRMEMGTELMFENHPSVKAPASGWQHCVYKFETPVNLEKNQIATVAAAHDRLVPWFSLIGVDKPSNS